MDFHPHRLDFEQQQSTPTARPRSPPMAFQMTSNDALYTPKESMGSSDPFYRSIDYLTSSAGRPGSLEISSPIELDLEGQVHKQTEALRLQHQAFNVERECWEMERDRLHKRIAALEHLLRSPRGSRSVETPPDAVFAGSGSHRDSPAKSPEFIPPPHSAPPQPVHHSHRFHSGTSSARMPSIAENESSPDMHRDRMDLPLRQNAPSHISIPQEAKTAHGEVRVESGVTTIILPEDPPSPAATDATERILSPPPPEYVKHAGHTPLRGPSRPTSSSSYRAITAALEDTPTKRNTARNIALSRQEEEEDVALIGPLQLPELPNKPGDQNFTMDALTARLQYMEEHPDESRPLALSAKFNCDTDSEVDASDSTIMQPTTTEVVAQHKDTPSLSQSQESAGELSPPPTSEASQVFTPQDVFQEHKGIKLKSRASMNFGAPLGQLRL